MNTKHIQAKKLLKGWREQLIYLNEGWGREEFEKQYQKILKYLNTK